MKWKLVLFLIAISLQTTLISCGDDDDNGTPACSTAYSTELQAEVNALNAAGQAYSTNPTPANCLAYKNAAQAYLNALAPYGNCSLLTGQAKTDWQASYDAAQAAVNAISC